jgi:putative tryptophan/tyrosine transport system substrate-binding protein
MRLVRGLDSVVDNRKSRTCGERHRTIQNLYWAMPKYRKLVGIVALVIAFAACGAVAHAQQSKKIFRIGYLAGTDRATNSTRSEPFRLALRDLGYIEGQNIEIEYRFAAGNLDRAPELAAELVRLKVDVIVVGGDTIVSAAKNATKTVPIIMMGQGADPVEAGLVESLARPGGNVTGITNITRELIGKRMELLKETVPKVAHVAFFHDPARVDIRRMKEIQAAAVPLGLTIRFWEVRGTEDFETVFAALTKDRPDGIQVGGGPLMFANQKRIAAFALKTRLPSVHNNREAVDAGGLIYYGADVADNYRRVALYVDRILKGAKPADLPVEQPTKFELIINQKTAKQIGVTIPNSVLAKTDRVIR